MSGCEEGRGDSECAQGDAGGGWRTSSPEPSGIKRANRGGGRGASCRIIQARFCLPGDFHGPLPVTPWNQRGRSHGKSWNRLYPASTGAEPMPVRRKGVAATRLGLVFLRRSSPGGRPHSLQPRPGVLRSRQWETGRGAGRKRKPARGEGWAACPPLLFLCLEAFSRRLQASGRRGCHPWVSGSKICSGPHRSLRDIPRNPPGLLPILPSPPPPPDSRIRLLEHLCFRCSEGGG